MTNTYDPPPIDSDPTISRKPSSTSTEDVRDDWPGRISPELTALPEEILARHDARILNPRDALETQDYSAKGSAVYLRGQLLIRSDRRDVVDRLNKVLSADLGVMIKPADPSNELIYRGLLTPSDPELPVRVDAWSAYVALHAATEGKQPRLTKEDVASVSLNHVLIGASMGGAGGSSGILRGGPGAVGGNPYPGSDPDELGYWRQPVMIRLPPPGRRPDSSGFRRPMIAVLDTGVAENGRLGVPARELPNGPVVVPNGVVTVDAQLQADIEANNASDVPQGFWDNPYTTEPLTGLLSTHAGHGTFIMGIIQQIAPDANMLAIRLMHNDGVADSGSVSYALKRLYERVVAAQDNGDAANMVDIVSMSFGAYLENDFGTAQLDELTSAIDALRSRGVLVVAAAGNYASSREFWPAALANRAADPVVGAPPVISVGARNPNLTKTLFSNDGEWVSHWAPGAAVISTFPETTNASRNPAYRVMQSASNGTLGIREDMEADDYIAGYAVWSGTSFATPLVAGRLANLLMEDSHRRVNLEDTLARASAAAKKLPMP